MEVDTSKAIVEQKQEEKRQKIRDERKLVDEIYNQYLINKHPNYPLAKDKISSEERKLGEEIRPKQSGQNGDDPAKLKAVPEKIDTLGKLDELQETTIKELDKYNNRQEELKKRLEEQQRVLNAVQNDIKKREELLNYVFGARKTDENQNGEGDGNHTSDTSSLMISAITTSQALGSSV